VLEGVKILFQDFKIQKEYFKLLATFYLKTALTVKQ